MKKIKQFSLKAMLLTIVAALTIGFTGCSDELSGDQTQGKPGYLTVNVKTLKPNQTKVSGDGANDYQTINDLNIFVFNSAGDKLTQKYYPAPEVSEGATSISIQVSTLPAEAYVVAVANYGDRIDGVLTFDKLEAVEVVTVRDFATLGLHMTGKANIETLDNGYNTNVKVAPVEAKITVDWVLTENVALYYDVTGVYVTNAVSNTKLPIIRDNVYTSPSWNATNILPADYINLTGDTPARTAASGLIEEGKDFNFYYTADVTNENLKDEVPEDFETADGISLPGTYTKLIDATNTKLHYYVGENYSNNDTPTAVGTGAMVADLAANSTHQNTLVVVRVTPLSTAPTYIKAMGHKYYTYEFNKGSTGQNNSHLGGGEIADDGFSVRRKTNYNLAFNLSSIGTVNPYDRLKTLTVIVTAEEWDDQGVTAGF